MLRAAPLRLAVLLAAVVGMSACSVGPPRTDADASEPSGTLTVYAAASLSTVFDRIGDAFEQTQPGVQVTAVYDGSRTLATQIAEGAPADVFASADEGNMDAIGDAAVDPRLFASNTLVIAVPAGNPAGIADLDDLPAAVTVLCAPEVPCGAASRALLSSAGVDVVPASLEQNVSAVLAKVATGEADAGLVYATDVRDRADVSGIVPEGAASVVNRYPLTVVRDARNPVAARAFVDFVLSDEAQGLLADAGFGAP